MSELIKDGTGTGNYAKVNGEGRLFTRSVTRSEIANSVDNGVTWNIGTGFLTLTTVAAHPLLYLKNTGAINLEISLYVILTKASTNGDGSDGLVEIYRNPTAGTIVTDETAVEPVNMNFGSSNEITADVYSGGQGKTVSGYDNILRSKVGDEDRLLLGVLTNLPRGASVAISYTPPTGTTSIDVEAVVEIYEES